MKDITTSPVDGQTLSLNSDTQIYLCASERVRLFEIDVLETIGSILNFRASGLRIAREVLRRQGGEDVSIELTHEKIAEEMWPDLEAGARVRKYTRGLKNLREDMDLTGFSVVNPRRRKPQLTEDGFRGLPTSYEPGAYWQASNALQERAKKVDFFAMPVDRRRRKVRDELKTILANMDCRRAVREKKDDKVRPPNPSLPCKCACASCQTCAAKSVTGSEAEKRPAQERITKSGVALRMGNALEELFECGAQWANLELDMKEYWVKVTTEISVLDQRLAGAVKRHNAPKVKMNGGQPK